MPPGTSGTMSEAPPTWLERFLAGDRLALARAITAVESDGAAAAPVLRAIYPHLGRARVVGITGAPGAGKSTLVNAYIAELRRRGQTVGVVAVDPSSPLTGGAILGDRIRMTGHSGDPGVFVRSLATRGHLGGLSRVASRVIDVMDAAGRDVVVVETVGAGQSEIEVAEIADTRVLVAAPGLGDEIQTLKAGIVEIADILVVNKADLPAARSTAAQFEAAFALVGATGRPLPVLLTAALRGEGVPALADVIERHDAQGRRREDRANPRRRVRRLLGALVAERLRTRLQAQEDPAFDALCEAVLKGELGFEDAAERAIAALSPPRRRS